MLDPEKCETEFDIEDIQEAIEEAEAGTTYSEEEFYRLLAENEE